MFIMTAKLDKRKLLIAAAAVIAAIVLLLALGAVNSEIRRAHRTEGVMLSGLSVLLTLGLSFLLNWLVFSVMNTWFPSYGILSGAVRSSFGISPLMLAVCLGVALICGFLSCEIPYH